MESPRPPECFYSHGNKLNALKELPTEAEKTERLLEAYKYLLEWFGEDLPEEEQTPKAMPSKASNGPKKASVEDKAYISSNASEEQLRKLLKAYNLESFEDLTDEQAKKAIMAINKRKVENNAL